MAAAGGIMVPKFVMPGFMQRLVEVSPMNWGLEALLTVLLRGGVGGALPFAMRLTAFAALMLLLAWVLFSKERTMTAGRAQLIAELKDLVLEAAEKSAPHGGLADEVLFGPDSRLEFDSLDGLQLSMAIQQRYGVRMADSKDVRRALASIATLADYLQLRLA